MHINYKWVCPLISWAAILVGRLPTIGHVILLIFHSSFMNQGFAGSLVLWNHEMAHTGPIYNDTQWKSPSEMIQAWDRIYYDILWWYVPSLLLWLWSTLFLQVSPLMTRVHQWLIRWDLGMAGPAAAGCCAGRDDQLSIDHWNLRRLHQRCGQGAGGFLWQDRRRKRPGEMR